VHRGSVLEFRISLYPADHPAAGRLATVVNADGKEQHLAYTTRGEQRAVWGDSVQPLLYDYNEYGERVGMRTFQTTPDGDPSHVEDTGAKTAWHFHEATGSLLRKEYADGKGPEYAYNEAGQLAERRWARESSPQRPQRGTEGEGNPSVAGTGTAGVPPASQAGAAASRIITAYTYDPATLQLAKSIATDGTAVQYEYDPDGRLAKVTDATGTREFAYDQRGQVTKETVVLQHDPAADPIRYEIRRTYTALGQPESVHLVSADGQSVALDHQIGYAWNEHSQLASVKSLAGEFAYGYDAKNPALLTKMTGPVHEVETSYEPHRNLVTGVVNKAKPGGARSPLPASPNPAPVADSDPGTKNEEPSTLSSYTYANDLLGRRETISQGGDAFGMLKLGHNQVEVAYNDRSEVTGAVYRSNTETRQNFDYTYDAIGNRERTVSEIDSKRSELSYETNALNQYKKISANQRQLAVPYDLDGNLLEDARNTYTWNADNNLIRVDAKDGTLRLDYIYDHQSRRTVRVETTKPGTKNEAQRTTYYLYDEWNLVAEHSAVMGHGAGVTGEEADSVRYYTWGRDLSGSLQGAGGVGGLLAISKSSPGADKPGGAQLKTSNLKLETLFPTYDANGNIGQLINADANVVAAYAYDPFGNVTEMAGAEAAENPWRFSTKPVEAGTGWLYYGYRWYDAETGRWVNRDPIEESGGVNLYGFVGNDSTNWVDLLGLCSADFSCCPGAPGGENSDTLDGAPCCTQEEVDKIMAEKTQMIADSNSWNSTSPPYKVRNRPIGTKGNECHDQADALATELRSKNYKYWLARGTAQRSNMGENWPASIAKRHNVTHVQPIHRALECNCEDFTIDPFKGANSKPPYTCREESLQDFFRGFKNNEYF
jgi:RHS repeat-associated protein